MYCKWFRRILLIALACVQVVGWQQCSKATMEGAVTMDCRFLKMHKLPSDLLNDVGTLLMSYNRLSYLPPNAFKSVNITHLDLSHNEISSFAARCFQGMHHLKTMNLNYNRIIMGYGAFPRGIFSDLISLRVLRVVGHESGEYPAESFVDLVSLEVLSLSLLGDNSIPWQWSRLTQLRILDFYNGKTSKLTSRMLDGIRRSNISVIAFRNVNDLLSIEDGMFSNFPRLRTINLACNYGLAHEMVVKSLGTTQNTPVQTVIIDGCEAKGKISVYDSDNFCKPFWKGVRQLSMRNNKLSIFRLRQHSICLQNVSKLVLSYNVPLKLEAPSKKAEDVLKQFPSLELFDFSFVPLLGQHFRNTFCDHADMYDPHDYFPHPPNLITNNSTKSGNMLQFLKYVYIRHIKWPTRIRKTQHDATVFHNVLLINASNSFIATRFNGSLYGLSNLQVVDYSYCKLEYISPNIFRDMQNLRFLNLSHNNLERNIGQVSDAISYLYLLEDLDLSSNKLKTIPPQIASNRSTLRILKFRSNLLHDVEFDISKLISLELLDLQNNMISRLSNVFCKSLDVLHSVQSFRLDIGGNPLACNCKTIHFIRWVQTTEVALVGRESLACIHKNHSVLIVQFQLDSYEKECSQSSITVTMVVSCCVGTVLLFVGLLCIRYHRWYIVYHGSLFFNRRIRLTSEAEKHNYGAIIIYYVYTTRDIWDFDHIQEWVGNELMRRAEKEWGIPLYVGGLHDKVGFTKQDNFLYGFQKSEYAIFCLTTLVPVEYQLGNTFNLAIASNKPLSNYIFIIFDGNDISTSSTTLRRLLQPRSPATTLRWVNDDEKAQTSFWRRLRLALIRGATDGACPSYIPLIGMT